MATQNNSTSKHQLEWIERYLRRLAELQPGAAENDDMDQADDVWRSARGDLTPEQAAEAVAKDNLRRT